MAIKIVHDYLQTTQNGYVLNVYLSRDSDVEFAEDLGRLGNRQDDAALFSYIHNHYPHTPISQIRMIDSEGDVHRLSLMSVMGDARPEM